MKVKLANDALLMTIWSRKPIKGLITHSDRGSQYASKSHRKIIEEHHLVQSMSRKGDCWDNAVAESFFHSLKTELIHHCQFKTREEAKREIFEYIEVFYNRERIHSIRRMVICRQWNMKIVTNLGKFVSGKVLTHQPHAEHETGYSFRFYNEKTCLAES